MSTAAQLRQELVKSELAAFRRIIRETNTAFDQYLLEKYRYQQPGFIRRSQADQQRLFNLKTWSTRHKVSIDYILDAIVPYWVSFGERTLRLKYGERKLQHLRAKGKFVGLGFKIWSLMGKRSEQMLQEKILSDFPNGENVDEWKQNKRMELLGLNDGLVKIKTILDFNTLEDFVNSYRAKVEQKQSRLDRAMGNPKRKRRAYRDNPFL